MQPAAEPSPADSHLADGGHAARAGPLPPSAAAAAEEMLTRLRARDREALAGLVRHFGPLLTRTAWLYLGDAHAAEDAVQETLLAAWDSARRTSAATHPESWLLGILMNQCRKFIRTAVRRRKRENKAARGEVSTPGTAHPEENLRALQQALLRLKPEHQEMILLRYYRGLSVEETGTALGLPAGTVKSRSFAAMGELRRLMESHHEPG